jgi:hypothetical protein
MMGGASEGHRDNIRSSAGAVYLWKLCCLDHSRPESKKLKHSPPMLLAHFVSDAGVG